MKAQSLSRYAFVIVAFLCANLSGSAQTQPVKCDWTAFERSAAEMRAARDAAQKISEDEGNTDVPPEAIKQIQQFKHSLYTALQSYFLCQPNSAFEVRKLEGDLYARLAIPVPPPPDKQSIFDENDGGPWTGLYLDDVSIKVETIPDARKLVAILTGFGIPYGSDAELDVFAPGEDGKLKPAVNFTSKPYNSIAGAFEGLDYMISPRDPKGSWFVVATHVNPWPTSCWQGLFIDAVRPSDLGMQYQLFHDEQYGYICNDIPPYLRSVSADGFQIQFSIQSIDESRGSSVSLMNYKIVDDEVVRIQPVGLDPVNFVDEWVRRPWRDAQDWSAQGNLTNLHNRHLKLHKLGATDFVAFRNCAIASTSEVEAAENAGDGPSHFFIVKTRGGRFTMLRVSDRPADSCKGPNQLSSIRDR
jgi:hypothetical protein